MQYFLKEKLDQANHDIKRQALKNDCAVERVNISPVAVS
jgi:hypothetical protein